jgi:hypothetical protein
MAGKGGIDANLQEVILTGPFKGMQPDTSTWYMGPPGYTAWSQNLDYLRGELKTRSGSSSDLTFDTLVSAPVLGNQAPFDTRPWTVNTNPYYNIADGFNFRQGEPGYFYGKYNIWSSYYRPAGATSTGVKYLSFPIKFAGDGNYFDKTGGTTTIEYNYALFKDVSPAGVARTVVTSNVSNIVGWNGSADFTRVCPIGMLFCAAADVGTPSNWRLVIGASTTNLYLSENAASTHAGPGGTEYYLIPALSGKWMDLYGGTFTPSSGGVPTTQVPDAGRYNCTTYIPAIGGVFVGGWLHGGLIYLNGTWAGTGKVTVGLDNNHTGYFTKACAYYNNRLVMACPQSAVYTSAAGGSWQLETHPARIVYSKNGTFWDINPTNGIGAGFFESDLGQINDLFVLRDTLYGLSQSGIIAIQKTGNSTMPFRQQTVLRTNTLTDTQAAVVEESYAVISTLTGPMKFDGSSLQPLAPGVDEIFRGLTVNWIRYDFVRKRLFFNTSNSLISSLFLCYDLVSQTWTTWLTVNSLGTNSTNAKIIDATGWCSMQSPTVGEQDEEFVMLAAEDPAGTAQKGGAVVFKRTLSTDSASPLVWYTTTAVIDSSKSRDTRSATKIRVTYEVTSTTPTAYTPITVTLYTDGGTTPVYTGTLETAGGTVGAIVDGYLSFAPITGTHWTLKIGGSNNIKVDIFQIALYFEERQEKRPN